ncbi:MAG: IPT/TIG domain-containing protein [Nitrospiraceae bacterium]
MRPTYTGLLFAALAAAVIAAPSGLRAQNGQMSEGAGFTMWGLESTQGSDEEKIQKDPVCDRSRRPLVKAVEPDEVKPGQKITIKGENFGTKECFHGVSFSAASKSPVNYTLVNDTTIEATVPDVKTGMTFVVIVAGGGSAQSKGVLVLPQ